MTFESNIFSLFFSAFFLHRYNFKKPGETKKQSNNHPPCSHNESWGQMFSHLKKLYTGKHVYALRRQLLGDELHMQKETSKAASVRHQQRHVFLVTDTTVLYLHHSNFFHEYIYLPNSNNILFIRKINCHCLEGTRSQTLCQFLPFFSIFPVRKWFCV